MVGERDERTASAAAGRISQSLLRVQRDLLGAVIRLRSGAPPGTALEELRTEAMDTSFQLAVLESGQVVAGAIPWDVSPSAVQDTFAAGTGRVPYASVSDREGDFYAVVWLAEGPYIVVAFIRMEDTMLSAMPARPAAEHFHAFVVDRRSHVLASLGSAAPGEEQATRMGVPEALRGLAGITYAPGLGSEYVIAYDPIDPAGWAFVAEEPWQNELSPLLRPHYALPLTLAPAIALALLAAFMGTRRVVGPLRELESMAGRIAGGDYETADVPLRGVAEIGRLQQSLFDLARRVQEGQKTLRGYIARVTQAQEEERRHLARDLHDETIQDLIALDQKLQMLAEAARRRDEIQLCELEDLHRDAQEQITKMRRLTRALRPVSLDELGILPALEALAADAGRDMGLPVVFGSTGKERALSAEQSLAVYRIVQEALSNVGRHSRARCAWVDVRLETDQLHVEVRDDGQGFVMPNDLAALSQNAHYGIIGMLERALLIGAKLTVLSSPGSGTRVTLDLPDTAAHTTRH